MKTGIKMIAFFLAFSFLFFLNLGLLNNSRLKEQHNIDNLNTDQLNSYDFFISTAYSMDDLTTASVNGKYQNLLMTLNVPGDQSKYGSFKDWGYWSGTTYAGYSNLPPGYWVYVYPNWYIWGSLASSGGTDYGEASVNGKYYNLLRTIYVPSDKTKYGNFKDWGYWSGTTYAGHSNLPTGYWVYVYPNWYIWGNKK